MIPFHPCIRKSFAKAIIEISATDKDDLFSIKRVALEIDSKDEELGEVMTSLLEDTNISIRFLKKVIL